MGPSLPASTIRRSSRATGWKRVHMASMQNTPSAVAASTTSCAPANVAVKAFSTRTALWLRIASSAIALCCGCGVAT